MTLHERKLFRGERTRLQQNSVRDTNLADVVQISAAMERVQVLTAEPEGPAQSHGMARQSLAVKVAGSGDVSYYGDPAVASKIAGSGTVKRLGAAPA